MNSSISMKPSFFATPQKFRQWLEKNHEKKTELLVGFYKVGSGKPSMTWSQSVDEALCFGWIDGVRRSAGEESYTIRFTPRQASSIWSTVNINKIKSLKKAGLLMPAGLAAFEKRKENRSGIYAYEKIPEKLDAAFEKKFRANKTAWDFFETQAPWYKRTVTHWVVSAKQQDTKEKRLEKLIAASAAAERLR